MHLRGCPVLQTLSRSPLPQRSLIWLLCLQQTVDMAMHSLVGGHTSLHCMCNFQHPNQSAGLSAFVASSTTEQMFQERQACPNILAVLTHACDWVRGRFHLPWQCHNAPLRNHACTWKSSFGWTGLKVPLFKMSQSLDFGRRSPVNKKMTGPCLCQL